MRTKLLLFGMGIALLSSCSDEKAIDQTIRKEVLSGVVQKGPFSNGSSITISALDQELSQSGVQYQTSISDNSGKFEQLNIELPSNFVALRAEGYYFDENKGALSSAPLTLNAISDITDINSVNVNILTHLEKSRIEYLVKEKNLTFEAARQQANKEVLKIFSITKPDMGKAEKLNLIQEGDDNAILFAISVILQGYRTTADMSELMANIITDIRQDGILNDSAIGSSLLDDAKVLKLAQIRTNMSNRYTSFGMTSTIPNFEKYVKCFIDSTSFKSKKVIEYPVTSEYGLNALYDTVHTILPGIKYSLAAKLPVGMKLKVMLKGAMWAYRVMPSGPINWTISDYDRKKKEQTFTVTESGKSSDVYIDLNFKGSVTVEYYENGATTPTKTKILKLTGLWDPFEPYTPSPDTIQ